MRRARALLSVAAIVAVVILAWWGVSELQGPTLSAAELLAASRTTERAWLAQPEVVVHRTLTVKERRLPENVVIRTRRVDVWQTGERGLTVRRAYDAENEVVGGEWIDRTDTRTLYRPGVKPAPIALDPHAVMRDPEHAWRLELSADTFSALAPAGDTRVTRSGDRLTLKWQGEALAGMTRAELTLAGDELRPVAQTLTIREADSRSRELRFEEVSAVEMPASQVMAALFEPDAELLPAIAAPVASPASVSAAPTAVALAAKRLDTLELDVWYRAHLLGLTFDRDVRVSRTDGGRVRMQIGVANEFRRAALAARLGELADHPSVTLSFSQPPAPARRDAGDDSDGPLFEAMREQYASQMPADAALSAARATVTSARMQLDRHRARANALRAFVTRWPVESLNPERKDEVAHWSTVVRDHALALGESAQVLRDTLSSVLPPTSVPSQESLATPAAIMNVKDATSAIESLLAACDALATELRDMVTDKADPPADVDLRPLGDTLRRVERAARSFAGAWYFSLD